MNSLALGFGGVGDNLTAMYLTDPKLAQALRKQQYAYNLLNQSQDNQPVISPWQGVNKLAQALLGGYLLNKTDAGFACGRIKAFATSPDVVLALHACDTATDDALAAAIAADARLILSVPCCHQALNAAVKPDGAATVLRPLLRHGILQQRTADILTDSFRALILASWATGPTWWSSSAPSTRRGT